MRNLREYPANADEILNFLNHLKNEVLIQHIKPGDMELVYLTKIIEFIEKNRENFDRTMAGK